MSHSRPGPWFPVLMGVSLVSAFVVPSRFTTPVRASVQGLFTPVSFPARAIAGAVYGRTHIERATDDGSPAAPRAADAVYAENHELRASLASLQVKFDELARVNADRQLVGDIRGSCQPATVTGADSSGVRESLKVSGVGSEAAGRPAVHGTDLVGRVEAAGLTGAAVRLVTDPGLSFSARLARYAPDANGRMAVSIVAQVHPLVQGVGNGGMAIRNAVTMADATALRLTVGDLVVLDDRDGWPANVQGFTVGRVTAINPQASAPIFADIRVAPVVDLRRLTEVMVVVRG